MARPRRPEDKQQRKEAREKFHGIVTRVANSPRFKDALGDFEDDPESAQADPRGFFESRGVELPDDVDITIEEREGSHCWCVRICWLWWCWWACFCDA